MSSQKIPPVGKAASCIQNRLSGRTLRYTEPFKCSLKKTFANELIAFQTRIIYDTASLNRKNLVITDVNTISEMKLLKSLTSHL